MDLISREELLKHGMLVEDSQGCQFMAVPEDVIVSADSADARPNIHAEWEKPTGKIQPFGEDTRQCTGCGFFTERDSCDIYNFCPICGADMREPKGEKKTGCTSTHNVLKR